jgi:DNA polymerase-3 subunit delta
MGDYNSIIREIQEGKFAPVYFLHGDEPFFIDNITSHIENNVLDETQKSFNQYVLYGKDTNFQQILSTAKKYPMMGERQVVIVKEAQDLKGWNNEQENDLFIHYLENPLPSTILLFAHKYKSLDKRKKLSKVIEKHSVAFESKKIYDNQVPSWIQSYAGARGAEITPKAVHLLAENIGNNLQRLSNEIEKLLLNVPKGLAIDDKAVHRHVGISKEYNVFELQKAIGMGNFNKALKIVKYFAANPTNNPIILTIGSLFSYFSKLLLLHTNQASDPQTIARVLKISPRFAPEYVSALKHYNLVKVLNNIQLIHEADLHSKGIGYNLTKGKEGELLKELVFKLMHQ